MACSKREIIGITAAVFALGWCSLAAGSASAGEAIRVHAAVHVQSAGPTPLHLVGGPSYYGARSYGRRYYSYRPSYNYRPYYSYRPYYAYPYYSYRPFYSSWGSWPYSTTYYGTYYRPYTTFYPGYSGGFYYGPYGYYRPYWGYNRFYGAPAYGYAYW